MKTILALLLIASPCVYADKFDDDMAAIPIRGGVVEPPNPAWAELRNQYRESINQLDESLARSTQKTSSGPETITINNETYPVLNGNGNMEVVGTVR